MKIAIEPKTTRLVLTVTGQEINMVLSARSICDLHDLPLARSPPGPSGQHEVETPHP